MRKILFLVQLPPPVHGASAVNKSIQGSTRINNEFITEYINISPGRELSDIGKFSLSKAAAFFTIYLSSVKSFLRFKPDLIYLTLSPHGLAFYKDGLIAISLKALGGKLVFHLHGKGIKQETEKSVVKQALYRWVFKDVAVIHLSKNLFYDIENVRDSRMPLIAVGNGIEQTHVNPRSEKPRNFTFIFLSNLDRAKGIDILLQSVLIVKTMAPNISFDVKIVGAFTKSFSENDLYEELSSPELCNTYYLGPKYGLDKFKELSSAHVFVLPTRYRNECFPLSILEAMSVGLPVISTNEGAISEIIEDKKNGIVINELTPDTLADSMLFFLENKRHYEVFSKSAHEKFNSSFTVHNFESNLSSGLEMILQTGKT